MVRYEEIGELGIAYTVDEVNKKLKEGWVYLDVLLLEEKITTEKGEAKKTVPAFLIARLREGAEGEKKKEQKNPWKRNDDGSEWASASDLPDLAEKLKEGPHIESGYMYWLSKNGKYVHRKRIEKNSNKNTN